MNKKFKQGQIGTMMTWIIATVIIFFIMLIYLAGILTLAAKNVEKKDLDLIKKTEEYKEGIVAKNNDFKKEFLGAKTNNEGKAIIYVVNTVTWGKIGIGDKIFGKYEQLEGITDYRITISESDGATAGSVNFVGERMITEIAILYDGEWRKYQCGEKKEVFDGPTNEMIDKVTEEPITKEMIKETLTETIKNNCGEIIGGRVK